jgi:hypothetical protein
MLPIGSVGTIIGITEDARALTYDSQATPQGMGTMLKDKVNAELLAFIKA